MNNELQQKKQLRSTPVSYIEFTYSAPHFCDEFPEQGELHLPSANCTFGSVCIVLSHRHTLLVI